MREAGIILILPEVALSRSEHSKGHDKHQTWPKADDPMSPDNHPGTLNRHEFASSLKLRGTWSCYNGEQDRVVSTKYILHSARSLAPKKRTVCCYDPQGTTGSNRLEVTGQSLRLKTAPKLQMVRSLGPEDVKCRWSRVQTWSVWLKSGHRPTRKVDGQR